MDTRFSLALARLDADITEMEARLQELRLRRRGAQAFLEYMEDLPEASAKDTVQASSRTTDEVAGEEGRPSISGSPTEAVMGVFRRVPGRVLSIDDVHRETQKDGWDFDRHQVRNAIHYATRKGWVQKSGRRGSWILTNVSAPGATGAEASEESTNDSSREEGGPDESSGLLRDQSGRPGLPYEPLGHDGLRASIGGSET